MKLTCKTLCACAVVAIAASALRAEGEGAATPTPAKDPAARGAERFKAMDADANGTVSLAEFTAAHEKRIADMKTRMGDKWDAEKAAKMPKPEEMFKKADVDADGALTPEELKDAGPRRMEGHPGGARGEKKQGGGAAAPAPAAAE